MKVRAKIILVMSISLLLFTACQKGTNPAQIDEPTVDTVELQVDAEQIAEPAANDVGLQVDEKINPEVVKVIQDHITAVQTRDEELIRATVLDALSFEERAFLLWQGSGSYELHTLTYGFGDEENEVVTVTFVDEAILSFALTKTEDGWKIYDVD